MQTKTPASFKAGVFAYDTLDVESKLSRDSEADGQVHGGQRVS